MQIISKQNTNEEVVLKRSKSSEDKAPHKRAYWVEKTRKELGTNQDGQPFRFGYVNGRSAHLTIKQLRDRFYECQKADIPFAPLWFWKIKQDKNDKKGN